MMRRVLLVSLLVCLVVGVACTNEEPDVIVEVVETAVIPPTATTIPQPTNTDTATPTNTPQPTTTTEPTATNTPTITKTSTPSPSPTPTQPYREIEIVAGQDYQLRTPTPEDFLQALTVFYDNTQTAYGYGSYDYDLQINAQNAVKLNTFFSLIFDQSFPDGFPHSGALLASGNSPGHQYGFLRPIAKELALTGLMTQINQDGIEFKHATRMDLFELIVTPYGFQIDDDPDFEWILDIQTPLSIPMAWLYLDKNEDGDYTTVPLDSFLPSLTSVSAKPEFIHDFTGDGRSELTFTLFDYLGGGREGGFVKIYHLDGTQLQLLEDIQFSLRGSQGRVSYQIGDFDADDRAEVQVTWSRYSNWDCSWEYTDIYQWNGTQSNHQIHEDIPPNSLECKVSSALRDRELELIERIHLLEEVLNEWTSETAPSYDYYVYLNLRLAFFYYELGLDDDTLTRMPLIEPLASRSKLAQIINNNFASQNIVALCLGLHNLSGERNPELGTEIDFFISFTANGAYPGLAAPVPDAFCEPRQLLENRLGNLFFASTQSPEELMAELGFATTIATPLNLDDDPELEWSLLLEDTAILLILDDVNGRWQPLTTINLPSYNALSQPQISLSDADDDGIDDLIIQAQTETVCENNGFHEQWHGFINLNAPNFSLRHSTSCDTAVTAPQTDPFTTPFWDHLAEQFPWDANIYFDAPNGFGTFLSDASEQIQTQSAPDTLPDTLLNLIDALPQDDPSADIVRAQLQFLLGYHYELAGEEETAVTHYLTLIQQVPDSPWSWLAWARLKPTDE